MSYKKVLQMISGLLILLMVAGCSQPKEETVHPDDSSSTNNIAFSDDEGNFLLERAYVEKLYSINSLFLNHIQENNKEIDLNAWLQADSEKTKQAKYGISSPDQIPSMLRIIEEFNIERVTFEQFNNDLIAGYQERENADTLIAKYCYTKEEVDALYSNDPVLIAQAFASEYAIIANGKAYAPNFYLYATETELTSYGISSEAIQTQKNRLLSDAVIEAQPTTTE